MIIESTYIDSERMPDKYANIGVAGGQNVSPPFRWRDAPMGTESFALTMIDHHPVANHFVHWLVIDIPVSAEGIDEGASGTDKMPSGAEELNSSYQQRGYGGPRPPAGTGNHGYETIVYALNVSRLDLGAEATRQEFEAALAGKVLARAKLTGFYSQ